MFTVLCWFINNKGNISYKRLTFFSMRPAYSYTFRNTKLMSMSIESEHFHAPVDFLATLISFLKPLNSDLVMSTDLPSWTCCPHLLYLTLLSTSAVYMHCHLAAGIQRVNQLLVFNLWASLPDDRSNHPNSHSLKWGKKRKEKRTKMMSLFRRRKDVPPKTYKVQTTV